MGLSKEHRLILVILMCGTFLVALKTNLLSPALASIMADLNVDATTVQYAMSAYSLVEAIIIPMSAYLLGRFSLRHLFTFGMVTFSIGSLIAAVSPNIVFLLIGRVLQAIAVGIFIPMTFSVVVLLFPREHRGSGMGLVTLIVGFAPAVGPTLSGLLIDSIGWRMLFVVVLIAAILILVFGIIMLANFGNFEPTTLDIPSVIMCTLGLILWLYGFSSFSTAEIVAIPIIMILIGLLFLILFVRRQLSLKVPLLKISIFKVRTFRLSAIMVILCFGCQICMGTLLPIYLQNDSGYSAFQTGLVMLPGAFVGAFMGFLSGMLFDRFGASKFVMPWLCIFALGGLLWITYGIDTSTILVAIIYGLLIVGVQYSMTPMNTWGLNSLDNSVIQHANAIYNTLNQVAASMFTALAISIAALGPYVNPTGTPVEQTMSGDTMAFTMIAILSVLALVLAIIFVRDRKTEPSREGTYSIEEFSKENSEAIPVGRVMNEDPYFIKDNSTVKEAVDLLVEKRTSGVPVVDADLKVVGFVSDGDIMKYIGRSDNILDATFTFISLPDVENFSERVSSLLKLNVMKIATKNVVTISAETPLEDVCTLMAERHLKKIPIIYEGKLKGTLSRSDIIRKSLYGLMEASEDGAKALEQHENHA
ncbi:MAG: DHA2 family efflux MFS transporter permease subunit [Eggerthellaceae bacterium]|nr:DHA2 family efflux MFS transporter permease subunit [Eggerthellaceae bacterium]